jgi:hypothetical protein
MTFVPHILNLFSKNTIRAHVVYGPPLVGITDRKELALQLHTWISTTLAQEHTRLGHKV